MWDDKSWSDVVEARGHLQRLLDLLPKSDRPDDSSPDRVWAIFLEASEAANFGASAASWCKSSAP